MSNPNRVMANAARVQSSTYDCFSTPAQAGAFERAVQAQGFKKIRSSRFRVGPRGFDQKFSYRVSVYWNEGPGPDTESARRAAMGY